MLAIHALRAKLCDLLEVTPPMRCAAAAQPGIGGRIDEPPAMVPPSKPLVGPPWALGIEFLLCFEVTMIS